ncbi:MAG: acyl-CoA dehydrogenase family protein [Chitinophagales bacterium]|nr:acyl-CoA dehydrogenase family protein [Chitinophagales bacterium]MDW8417834.1 acyl-CoA dehydrogenase family protein [Chitinophagales bacterium]
MSTITQSKTTPLKGGEFIIKESQWQDVFIPEEITEEQRMLREATKDFVTKEVDPRLEELDKDPMKGVEILDKAAALGLLGLHIPKEYGGEGQDLTTYSFVTEIIGWAHGISVAIGAHTGIGTCPILYYGTEAQRAKYLPKLATGEWKAAYCLTEPWSGSDALGARTKAVLSDDGKHYIINGQKMWITNAGFADVFIVFAKIDGDDKKFTAFIVERSMEGVSVGAEEKKMGIKSSSTRQVFFNNVKVPVENLLGEPGKGHKIAFQILNIGRYKLANGVLGGAKRAIGAAVRYANERQQFKTPIAQFGAIKHKLGEMAIRTWVGESASYRLCDLIHRKEEELKAAGKTMTEYLTGGAEEYQVECAIMKVVGSETLDFVVDEGLQIYGGYGFSEEYPMARSYRDSRINRIFEGTNEINRMLSIDALFKMAMRGKLDLMTPGMAIQKELMSVPDMSSPDPDDIFGAERRALKNAKKAFLLVAGGAVQKLMTALEKEQEILMHSADILIEIWLMESAMLRAEKLLNLHGREAAQIYVDMVKCYFFDALDRIFNAGKSALVAYASGDELRIMLMGLKRFTKYELINTKEIRRAVADRLIAENGYCFWD